jgi:hypothetical protein
MLPFVAQDVVCHRAVRGLQRARWRLMLCATAADSVHCMQARQVSAARTITGGKQLPCEEASMGLNTL